MNFFENIAVIPTIIGIYQGRLGDVKSPIMLPVTSAALGKNCLTFRILTNKRSKTTVDIKDSRKTRRAFCEGLFRNAVIKINVRKIPSCVFEVFSKLINAFSMI